MTRRTRRVVGAFDDPHQADAVARDVEELDDADHVRENAEEDAAAAFEGTAIGRGDSAERQPDVTVAVDVPEDEVEEVLDEMRRHGAEVIDIEAAADERETTRSGGKDDDDGN